MMREIQIKEFAKVKGGKRLPKGHSYSEEKTDYPYLRVTDFGNYTIENITDLKYLKKETHAAIKRYIISKDDIYVSIAGTIGKVGYIPKHLDGSNLTENAAKISEINGFELKYLVFYLSSMLAQDQIDENTKATSQPKLALYRIESIRVPLLPLPEQRAIVAKIEQLFSELDNGMANLKAAKDKLEIYRQAVLKKAFEDGFGIINFKKDWNIYAINKLCEVVRGGSPRPAGDLKYYDGDIPFLKVADLTRNRGVFLNEHTYTIKEAGLKKTRLVSENTLLLSNSGATLGVPKICMFQTTFNDGIAAFLGLNKESLKYHYYFWCSKTFELRSINQGAAQPNLNTNLIGQVEIPIGPIDEMNQIVQEIESRLSVCDNILANIEESLSTCEALRQSILKQAFEGKLLSEQELEACRQEPDWEPAEQLLKRIKSQKTSAA